jgi:hypothetical protein
MKWACFVISIVLMASIGTGCAVFGRGKNFVPFDENALKQVTTGKTSASEVTQLFGPPNKIVKLSNGNAYVYERSVDKGTGLWLVLLTFANFDTQYDRGVGGFWNRLHRKFSRQIGSRLPDWHASI